MFGDVERKERKEKYDWCGHKDSSIVSSKRTVKEEDRSIRVNQPRTDNLEVNHEWLKDNDSISR